MFNYARYTSLIFFIKKTKDNPKDEQFIVLHFETGIESVSLATCDISYSLLNTHFSILNSFIESRSSAWLEHYTDNVGVSSSNLLGTTRVVLQYGVFSI